ncbi:MAG: hypothetical protein ABSA40_07510 [Candidatus Dormibacteria bacterium]|jgi:hypothetical protein
MSKADDSTRATTPGALAERRAPWLERLDGLCTPTGILLVSVLIIIALPVTSSIGDPDFWWHLRTGQLLIANHLQLLGTDPYTYTVAGHHWTMHEWLAEVLYALIVRWGGLGPIVLLFSLLTWAGLVCIALRAWLHTHSRVAVSIGLVVAVVAAYPIWGPRDQMVDFTFSCFLLLVVERYLTRGGRALWVLPPLFLLWSNLHGGFVLGLAFLAIVAVAEACGGRLRMPDPVPSRRVAILGLTTLGCALVSMINPNGPGILLYAIGTVTSPAQQALILEWQSPNFADWAVRGFAVMLLSLAAFAIANRRMRARDAALVVATAALAFQSVRNLAIFVAAAGPVWIEQFSVLLERLGERRGHPAAVAVTQPPDGPPDGAAAPSATRAPGPPLAMRLTTLLLVAVLLLVGYAGLRLAPAMAVTPTSAAYDQAYPVCASRWLQSAPRDLRIFDQYGEGGYLAWSLAGTGDKIFIFGDAALMGDSLLYTYADVVSLRPGWEQILARFGTQVVLFDTGTPLDAVLRESPQWVRVYSDRYHEAFVLRDQRTSLNLPAPPAASPACDGPAPGTT